MTAGQCSDITQLVPLLDGISVPLPGGGRRKRPGALRVDRAYGVTGMRRLLARRRVRCVCPERADARAARLRRGTRGGRPPAFDAIAYQGRNVVERCFNRLKDWRAIATRYDKRGLNYLAAVTFASIVLWIGGS